MIAIYVAAGLVGFLLVLHLIAMICAARIRRAPDRYSDDVLSQEPQGQTETIPGPDGNQIRTVTAGEGPTVVLAHGFSITLQEWNVVFDLLVKKGYRVIAFDQRGHGQSDPGPEEITSQRMASDYVAVLEHFDVRDGILIGHSMGGFLSIVFLLRHAQVAKDRLKGVILFATMAGDVLRGSLQNRLQIPLIRWGIIQCLVRCRTWSILFGRSLFGENPSLSGIQVFVELFLVQNHRRLLPILHAMAYENYYPELGNITTPCVVICGEQDKTTPRWHSERMAQVIPNANDDVVWVEGAGHMLNWEAPEALIEAVGSL